MSDINECYIPMIQYLGVKNQLLISRCLDLGFINEIKHLKQIDAELIALLMQYKMFGGSTHYIWHTQEDDRVRPSHAANDKKIFAWGNPPATGNPGEDYNCRCWAEPIKKDEYMHQDVTSIVDEGLNRWEWYDFVIHFYFGKGAAVELWQIGHLQDVINLASQENERQVFRGVENQTADKAREVVEGSFSDSFENTYNFKPVSFVHGDSTVKGSINGTTREDKQSLIISAKISYTFSDVFTDPLDIIELSTHTPKDIEQFVQLVIMSLANEKHLSIDEVIQIYKKVPKYTVNDIVNWLKIVSEVGGTKYNISGHWTTQLNGIVNEDRNTSIYKTVRKEKRNTMLAI